MCQKNFYRYNNIKIKQKLVLLQILVFWESTTVAFLKNNNKIKNDSYDYCNNKFFSIIKKEIIQNQNLIIICQKNLNGLN